ncbi:hypothetical protein THIX_60453 [Thiomonas sp. X19]|uniref:hypothetical protein n=1 Tax=Thiomonas sp. X19 TaxID=1050370 RepID=UPI000B6B652A|nr:hypothetical protein [Thiomonas sp. X19]SCC94395.1 hypothetical protein THIX_60453 [Thiomonas sp. X19]
MNKIDNTMSNAAVFWNKKARCLVLYENPGCAVAAQFSSGWARRVDGFRLQRGALSLEDLLDDVWHFETHGGDGPNLENIQSVLVFETTSHMSPKLEFTRSEIKKAAA